MQGTPFLASAALSVIYFFWYTLLVVPSWDISGMMWRNHFLASKVLGLNFAKKPVIFWTNLQNWQKAYTTTSHYSRGKKQSPLPPGTRCRREPGWINWKWMTHESRLINQLAMIGHGPNKNHTEDIWIFVSTKHYKFLGWEWNNHSSKGEIVCVCVQILRVVSQYLTTHDCPLIHIITIILLLLLPSDTCFCPVGRSVDTF